MSRRPPDNSKSKKKHAANGPAVPRGDTLSKVPSVLPSATRRQKFLLAGAVGLQLLWIALLLVLVGLGIELPS